jgi:predicted DNA-binding transcriptional regulator AlpA
MTNTPKTRFVSAVEVCRDLGITSSTLNRWIQLGLFPAPMRLGLRKKVWVRTEMENFYQQKAAEAVKELA